MLIIMHSVSSSEKTVVPPRRHLTANTAHSNIKRLVIRTDMLYYFYYYLHNLFLHFARNKCVRVLKDTTASNPRF